MNVLNKAVRKMAEDAAANIERELHDFIKNHPFREPIIQHTIGFREEPKVVEKPLDKIYTIHLGNSATGAAFITLTTTLGDLMRAEGVWFEAGKTYEIGIREVGDEV